jgi:predicted restriction endonuclease
MTEAERVVVQRVGQDLFRRGLLEFWEGQCAITGLAVVELLRASHAKPWADCASDAERMDVHNGLLLAAHLDAAFDRGLITVSEEGVVVVSPRLPRDALPLLALSSPRHIRSLRAAHQPYLAWHRESVFRAV